MKRILEAFHEDPRLSAQGAPIRWSEAAALARALPPRTNLVVPKSRLLDPIPYARSRRGRGYGALRQFRCDAPRANLHIKEFENHWVMHVDGWNPHHHVWRHLATDRGFKQFFHLGHLEPQPVPAPVPTA